MNEIQWFSEHSNKFIGFGTNLRLYEAVRSEKSETTIVLIDSNEKYQFIKCAKTFASQDQLITALGSSEKLIVHNFTCPDKTTEFKLKSNALPLSLDWKDNHTVAFGLEKYHKLDNNLGVWDVTKNTIVQTFGAYESVVSVKWSNELLFAGLGDKYIKAYDSRTAAEALSIGSKCTSYLEFDPTNENLFNGLHETGIQFFDVRAFEKPLYVLTHKNNFQFSTWNRLTRVLGTILQDNSEIACYSIHNDTDNATIYPNLNRYFPFGKTDSKQFYLKNIAWYPQSYKQLLCLTISNKIISYDIPQNKSISFDNSNRVWFAEENFVKNMCPKTKSEENSDEIVVDEMKKRAMASYGLLDDIKQNGKIYLTHIWELLDSMTTKNCLTGFKFGHTDNEWSFSEKSDVVYSEWRDCHSMPAFKVYKSEQRNSLQAICGWDFNRDDETSMSQFIESLCMQKDHRRAALISVFLLNLKLAIDALMNSNETTLQMAAIALNAEKIPLISMDGSAIYGQLNDPYLKSIFSFIFESEDRLQKILNNNDLLLCDRVAFASIYLSDSELYDFLRTQIKTCIEDGNLIAIFLTGFTSDGISLLQSFLDTTDDIQTVSTIAARFFNNDQYSNFKVQYWISTYRNILDRWALFHERVKLDNIIGAKSLDQRPIFLLCNFCGRSAFQEEVPRKIEEVRVKVVNRCSACPHCRKPLPRCSLCLQHMGTLMCDVTDHNVARKDVNSYQTRAAFQNWFAFCLKCKHSGHTSHLTNWFKQYSECPIVGCNCRCFDDS